MVGDPQLFSLCSLPLGDPDSEMVSISLTSRVQMLVHIRLNWKNLIQAT